MEKIQEDICALSGRIAELLKEHEIRMTSYEFRLALKLEDEAPLDEALTYGCAQGEICEVMKDLFQLQGFKPPSAVQMLRKEQGLSSVITVVETPQFLSQSAASGEEQVAPRPKPQPRKRPSKKPRRSPSKKRYKLRPQKLKPVAPIEPYPSDFVHEDALCGVMGRFILARDRAEPWQLRILVTNDNRLKVSDDEISTAIHRLIEEKVIWRDERNVLHAGQPEQKPTR